MAGQYSQNFNFPLGTKTVSNVAGDRVLGGNGISYQLEPSVLPSTSKMEGRLLWRSTGFTSDITLKIILATTFNTTVGTELVSQVVGATQWNETDLFEFDTPVSKQWLVLVTNNPLAVGGADVDEAQLQLEGVADQMMSSFLLVM